MLIVGLVLSMLFVWQAATAKVTGSRYYRSEAVEETLGNIVIATGKISALWVVIGAAIYVGAPALI